MAINTVELNKLARNCIEDEPPHCVGGCPFNMDLRGFSAALAEGNFHEGRRIYEDKVFLPHIMSRICDAPCKKTCLRKDLGGAVEAHILEKACMGLAPKPDLSALPPVVPKRQRLAVVGAGLSGLYAAATLLGKKYTVTVFEATQTPGGSLRGVPGLEKPLEEDLAALSDAQFLYGIEVGMVVTPEDLAKQFDAVIICWGPEKGAEGLGKINRQTLQTETKNIFVAGGLLGPEIAASSSLVAESGRRAAISAERLFQSVSLTGNRAREGLFESGLFTNTEKIAPLPTALDVASDECTADEAKAEAARCIQCHCLECKRRCVFLQHFDMYSGAAIRPVIKNINITRQWGHRYANPFILGCTFCGLCGKVCPAKIDMGYINLSARRVMWDSTYLAPAIHDFPLRDMEFSMDEASLNRHQPGHTASRYALFPGCQLPASMPDTTKALYTFLTENLEGGVGLFMSCCGVPVRWSGRDDELKVARDKVTAEWQAMGEPELILCCPGCYKEFKENYPDIPVVFIAEILPGLLPEAKPAAEAFAYHDPCMTRGYPKVQDSSRALAARLGAAVEELAVNRDNTVCCSYGGMQYHANPGLSAETYNDRIAQSPLPYLTSCSNCRDFFRHGGKQSVHLLELYFGREENKGSSSYACLDFSKRRARRRQLLADLKTELWKEAPEESPEALKIVIPDELLAKMHTSCMLVEDVRGVIEAAEKTGQKALSGDTGHIVAGHRKRYITYWVEYTLEADGSALVRNCYTHRMQIHETPISEAAVAAES